MIYQSAYYIRGRGVLKKSIFLIHFVWVEMVILINVLTKIMKINHTKV
ncbi:hypothetical protein C8C85_0104 [Flavobacterium sp. 103]|nr:hypothetical protein C8C85_0104 [Flavobacterium sp. 103]